MRRSGFTLTELLVVLAIIAIVATQVLGMMQSQVQLFHSQKQVLDSMRLFAQEVMPHFREDTRSGAGVQ